MRLRLVVLLLAAVVATACGEPAAPAPDLDTTGPLTALAPCQSPPASTTEAPEGLIVPDGVVVTKVTPQKPLINVAAYVDMTPVQFEAAFKSMDDITVLMSENEVFEAELLISDGTHRNFLKAAATCQTGSQLIIVVAPELKAKDLPTPQGAATAPSPSPSPGSAP